MVTLVNNIYTSVTYKESLEIQTQVKHSPYPQGAYGFCMERLNRNDNVESRSCW
jgi:hypothetical protein